MLEQNITWKIWIDEIIAELEFDNNIGKNKSNKYKIWKIWDNEMNTGKSKDHLLRIYHLVLYKDYSRNRNI